MDPKDEVSNRSIFNRLISEVSAADIPSTSSETEDSKTPDPDHDRLDEQGVSSGISDSVLDGLAVNLRTMRLQDPEGYFNAGLSIFHHRQIFLKEITRGLLLLRNQELFTRASKRLQNILSLFQAVAANLEVRIPLQQDVIISKYITPYIIMEETDQEDQEKLRTLAVSVFTILLQSREPQILQYAMQNDDVISSCIFAVKVGDAESIAASLYTLESFFYDYATIDNICPEDKTSIVEMLDYAVAQLAEATAFSPCLLGLVLRCYVLQCQHPFFLNHYTKHLPEKLKDGTFTARISTQYPRIHQLHQQLLDFTNTRRK